MRQTTRAGLAALGLSLLAIGCAHAQQSAVDRDPNSNTRPHSIEGTWILTVTPLGAPSFAAYASYGEGGVLITSPERFPPTFGEAFGNSQGSWRTAGHGQFVSTHVGFRYAPAGSVLGTFKIRSSVQITAAESFEGQGQLQLCDAGFENCEAPFPGLSTVRGRRLPAEPPILP